MQRVFADVEGVLTCSWGSKEAFVAPLWSSVGQCRS